MQLRWYTTYDKNGLDSPTSLQYRENEEDEWQDVMYVRERAPDEEIKHGHF